MIDIIKSKRAFKEYVKEYDMNNEKIALKVRHTYRTLDVAQKIAEELKLEKEDIELAKLIGLLHDIGRFEQLRIYDTFSDRDSIDHGNFAVKILFEDGLIRKFIDDDKYDEIIFKAIKNHNKFKIQEGLSDKELLHAKIIRDADKTDIFAVFVEDIENGINVLYNYEEVSRQTVSPKIMETFRRHVQSNREDFKSPIDDYVNIIGFIFDYNFISGLRIIRENKYIEKVIKPIDICKDTKEQMKEIIDIANYYIEKRLQKGC